MRRRGAYDRTLTLVAPLDELVEPRDDAVCASRSPGCGEGGHQPMSGAGRGDAFGHVEDGLCITSTTLAAFVLTRGDP